MNRIYSVWILLSLIPFKQSYSQHLTSDAETRKEIGPGEVHSFQIDLDSTELAFIHFDQQGADILIEVRDPGGESIGEFDGTNGNQGPELVHILARKKGTYSLAVKLFEEQKKNGFYSVKLAKQFGPRESFSKQLDQFIGYWAEQGYLPGFAVAIVTKDEILFQKAYGFADIERQKPYTLETLQNIGSVSKTLLGTSLMKAVEEGKLQLNDPVNSYVPYQIYNPYFSNATITIRHLATHTSSLKDTEAYEKSYILREPFTYKRGELPKSEYKEFQFYTKNVVQPYSQFLESLYSEKGELYRKKNFHKYPSGSRFSYSNGGATVVAQVLSEVYNTPYNELTRSQILDPLGMNASGWSFEEIDQTQHARLYSFNQKPLPFYSIITYPDGGLISNVKDMTLYLQAQMKGYFGEGGLLLPESYQKMMSPQLNESQQTQKNRNYGIFWERRGKYIGHNGGDPGAVCFVRFNSETGVGRVIQTNIVPNQPMTVKAFFSIWSALEQFGIYLHASPASP
ncbi:MAG: serine hydrolase domain-containing protein [Bacteroidota bacterium]